MFYDVRQRNKYFGASRVVFLEVMWNPSVEKQAMKARLRENCLHLPSHYIRDNERGKAFLPSRERAIVKADV